MSDIIVFPDFEKFKHEVEDLRAEMSALLFERDDLIYVRCPNIEAAYYSILGQYEYNLYNLKIKLRELKRRAELIQSYINRQARVDLSHIDEIIKKELEEFQAKLNAELDKLNNAMEWKNAPKLSEEQSVELKKLYRQAVKSLHPDLNPNATEAQIRLFENAVEAYQNGDLATMRFIAMAVSNETFTSDEKDSYQKLKDERARLIDSIAALKIQIEDIKSSYPYVLKEILDSKENVERKKAELLSETDEYEGAISYYESHIAELLRQV